MSAPSSPAARVRICMVGNSGSGKSTLAREVAQRFGVPAIELDSIFHQPGWTQLEDDEFRARVAARLADAEGEFGGWVADGNYTSRLRDISFARADVVVWFDLPKWRVMWQLSKRTVARVATKRELWNGNVERWSNLVKWAPEENILRWAWTQHGKYRETYQRMSAEALTRGSTQASMGESTQPPTQWIRITNPRERDAVLQELCHRFSR